MRYHHNLLSITREQSYYDFKIGSFCLLALVQSVSDSLPVFHRTLFSPDGIQVPLCLDIEGDMINQPSVNQSLMIRGTPLVCRPVKSPIDLLTLQEIRARKAAWLPHPENMTALMSKDEERISSLISSMGLLSSPVRMLVMTAALDRAAENTTQTDFPRQSRCLSGQILQSLIVLIQPLLMKV